MNKRGERKVEKAESVEGGEYAVGYGKPPVKSRFQPGASGNPSGRPPKARDVSQDVKNVFLQNITVTEGGVTKSINAFTLLIKSLLREAVKGNIKAIAIAYKIATDFGVHTMKDEFEFDESLLTPEEAEIVRQSSMILLRKKVIHKYMDWKN